MIKQLITLEPAASKMSIVMLAGQTVYGRPTRNEFEDPCGDTTTETVTQVRQGSLVFRLQIAGCYDIAFLTCNSFSRLFI